MIFDLPAGYDVISLRTPTLPPATHTNCYIIGRRSGLVVDPGSPYAGEQERLNRKLFTLLGKGGTLAAVFLTHHHPDHLGGAAKTARTFDLPVCAHAQTLELARHQLDGLRQYEIAEDTILKVDHDRMLRAMHTPGHAPGHFCLFEEREHTLLGGDNVPGLGTTLIAPEGGDMALYLHSLERMAALDPLRILPAHGPVLRPGRPAIEKLIRHRHQREQRVLQALHHQNPRDVEAIARGAYDDVPRLVFRLAVRSTLAHLAKLISEGRARQTGRSFLATP